MMPADRKRLAALFAAFLFLLALGACAEGTIEETNNQDQNQTGTNGGGDNGSLDDCDDDDDCPDGEICVEVDGDGQCQLDDDNNELDDGASCTDDSECESGLCVDDVCVSECDNDGDCLEGWDCDEDGICQPPACTSDADCGADQACAVSPADDDGLETICLADNGGADSGGNCSAHDDCRARYCLDETCTTPCDDDDHCGTNQLCEETSISLDDQDAILDLCIPMQVEMCDAAVDCSADDMTCNAPTFGADGDIDGASCGFANPGESDLGEDCTASSDCESNLCRESDDGTTGECSVFCEDSDRDCADSQVCLRPEDLGICARTCDRNADCDGGNICALGADDDGSLIHYCEMPPGDKSTGEECDTDTDCESAICLSNVLTYEGSEGCIGDSQCPDDAECGCPSTDPSCTEHVCFIENQFCSELCDTTNGDADCQDGDHDLSRCADDIAVETDAGTQFESMCAPDN